MGEHTEARATWRNEHREKTLTTQADDLDLAIPKVRTGSFFPSLLERRRHIDQALYAVVMEAYVLGVSTRAVDDLVKALGADAGISKSEVSRICTGPDAELAAFRSCLPDHTRFPYLFLDATYVKAVRRAAGGLRWQRCRVHFMRNCLVVIPKGTGEMVAATIRTILAQPTAEAVRAQLDTVADMLGRQFPKVRSMLLDAKEDLTAFADFPHQHWKKVHSTSPLERLNREIKRRTDVLQVFPNPEAVLRPATAVLAELHDEWIAFPRRHLSEESMTAVYRNNSSTDTTALPGITNG